MATIGITVSDDLDLLVRWVDRATETLRRELDDAVKTSAREGNEIAKRSARITAGSHGRKYPGTFRAARVGYADFVYGPTGTGQGDMNFEEGPGKQSRPHRNLANSLDIVERRLDLRVASAIRKAVG